jgi:hypothetical protein
MDFSCTWKLNKKNPREDIPNEYINFFEVGFKNRSIFEGNTANNVETILKLID